MPEAAGGITLLGIALGASLLASLVWIASRRTFWSIVAIVTILGALAAIRSSTLWSIVLIAGASGVLLLLWRTGWRDVGTRTDVAVLLLVPMLLLIGVAGTCLASGLPLPVSGR